MSSRLRSLAERAALWLSGDNPTTGGYMVPASGWPGGVRDDDPPVDRLYELLDDTFDNYHDTAVASLAAMEVGTGERVSTELKPENFEVVADRDGEMSLRCALYGEDCWWDADIRDGRPDADLGSLLEVAREHMRTAHATVIEAESQYLPDAGVLYDAMTNTVLEDDEPQPSRFERFADRLLGIRRVK